MYLKAVLDTALSYSFPCLPDAELWLPSMPHYEVLLYLGPQTADQMIVETFKAVIQDKSFSLLIDFSKINVTVT